MRRREVTMPPCDMVHSQNDTRQDGDDGASWQLATVTKEKLGRVWEKMKVNGPGR